MDWEDSSGGSSGEDEIDDMWNIHKAVSNLRDSGSSIAHRSMRGLQLALTEGWLISRARDMCSFAHDRYRQAAQAEASNLPPETVAKMSFRVCHIWFSRYLLTHSQDHSDDDARDAYRCVSDRGARKAVGTFAQRLLTVIHGGNRCLNLLHDHPKRDELLDVLIDAGESAWARGAHEVGQFFRLLK